MKTEMKGGKKEEGKDGQTEAATQKDDHFVLRREPGSWSIVVVRCLLLMTTVPQIVRGQDLGPSYKTTERYCSKHRDCDKFSGELCWWAYDGCQRGKCRCPPNTHYQDIGGICKPFLQGGDHCTSSDKCLDGMSCIGGLCTCIQGRLTSDRRYCLRANEKLLGESCDAFTDRCYQLNQATGLTFSEVMCADGVCSCIPGLKQDHDRCRRSNVYEDCSADYHCQGGALCIYSKCQCPVNFTPTAGNTKCARDGAVTGLGLMEQCDEFHRRSYCGAGLICHKCDQHSQSICVRFLEASQAALLGRSVAHNSSNVLYLALFCLTAFYLLTVGS